MFVQRLIIILAVAYSDIAFGNVIKTFLRRETGGEKDKICAFMLVLAFNPPVHFKKLLLFFSY